jgi:putative addiction module killer protein/probable addiction module antidote protein
VIELRYYQTAAGERPFVEWLAGLNDRQARARVEARLARVAAGNLGDVETAGEGVLELRIDWGPGYRVYFSRLGQVSSFSFAGGTKGHSTRTSNVRKTISKTTRRAPRKGRHATAPSLPYEGWLIERLKDPAEAAAYLETVIEEGDQGAIMLALRQVAQAQGGVAGIARKAKLTREATYKMLSRSGNPELRSLTSVLRATGLRIAVKPIVKQAA